MLSILDMEWADFFLRGGVAVVAVAVVGRASVAVVAPLAAAFATALSAALAAILIAISPL